MRGLSSLLCSDCGAQPPPGIYVCIFPKRPTLVDQGAVSSLLPLKSVPPQVLLVLVSVPDLRALIRSGHRPGMPLGHFLPHGMGPSSCPYSCVFRTSLQLLALPATSTLHRATFVSRWAVGVASCPSSPFPPSSSFAKPPECVYQSKKAALLSFQPWWRLTG